MNVLWLPSWYPSIEAPQNGDFIERHACAVSKKTNVRVIYIQSTKKIKGVAVVNNFKNKNLSEKLVLFSSRRFFNAIYYIFYFYKHLKLDFKINGVPDIVHVHVCFRSGLFALWLKWRYGIQFVITEHWTFFSNERKNNYSNGNLVIKFLIKLIFKNAFYVLPVSGNLAKQLESFFPFIRPIVIPNVVDPGLFNYSNEYFDNQKPFKFIHVSSLNELKNPIKILRVFEKLRCNYPNRVVLEMIGEVNDDIKNTIDFENYNNGSVVFWGRKAHHTVASLMRTSDAFVLFSTSENLPCVIAESLCCGVPVISSAVGGIPEMLDESNGILVTPGDENALYSAMENMLINYNRYDRKNIASEAQSKYNPDKVGNQIYEVYNKVLAKE